MSRDLAIGVGLGIVLLLGTKYLVVGLDKWNVALHPGRREDPALGRFARPLLGLVEKH